MKKYHIFKSFSDSMTKAAAYHIPQRLCPVCHIWWSDIRSFINIEVNSYMLPHKHCTCLISATGPDRNCICRRTPAHNRWNRRMSCRLCGHSLKYCCEEVCFLLHYPYTSPSLCAGYCSSNLRKSPVNEQSSLYLILYAHRRGIQVINNLFSGKIFRLCNRFW